MFLPTMITQQIPTPMMRLRISTARRLRTEAGYTLFEIMLVLGIIAVLVGSAIYMLSGNIDVAKEQRVQSDVQAISMQLRTYEMLNYRKPTTEQGLKALMAFAAKLGGDKAEDHVGQVQPGYFSEPSALADYLAANPRYQTLLKLSEWKPMGPPDLSNLSRSAVQKVLVRREGSNWEDLFVNMQLAEIKGDQGELSTRRWLITTIYKQGTP
jgi:type II secretory pathway pseudopilin PulG